MTFGRDRRSSIRARPSRTGLARSAFARLTARATTRPTASPTPLLVLADHGASIGSCRAIRLSLVCANASVHDREWADLRDQPGVATRASVVDQQMCALHPCLVSRDADFACKSEDPIVLRSQPRAATIDGCAIGKLIGPDPPSDAVTGLENDDRLPALGQATCCGEAGVAGTDDTDVRLDPLPHRARTVALRSAAIASSSSSHDATLMPSGRTRSAPRPRTPSARAVKRSRT